MLAVISLFTFAHNCQSSGIFSEKPVVEVQNYDSSSSSKANGLDFEIIYDNSHCTYRGQVIQRIVGCSQTETYVCRDEDVLTTEKKNFLQTQVILSTTSFWKATLDTDSTSVTVDKGKCCAIEVPQSRTSYARYVMFVTFHPTSGSTVAWAGACRVDQNGRPFAGQANFGPNQVNVNKYEEAFKTAVHEFAHALGFSSSLFDGYKQKDSRTGKLVPYSQVSKQVTERGHTVTKVVTPNVIKFVSDHFNCPYMTTPGAELEDGGSDRTAGSHWEKRIFQDEVMVGDSGRNAVISPLTLALFADMGWYRVSGSHPAIGALKWGKGQGCQFAQDRCSSWPQGKYFCSSEKCAPGHESCSFDRKAKAFCNIASWSGSLPTYYQYFSDPAKGGGDKLADYCPFYESYGNGYCADTSQSSTEEYSDIRASDSICFSSTVKKTGPIKEFINDCNERDTALCHRHQCVDAGTSFAKLRVFFGRDNSHYVDCPSTGGVVDVYEKLNSRKFDCRDDTTWQTGYARPANCRDFVNSCNRFENLGQYTKCAATCRTCAAYEGTVTCPPVSEVCAVSSSSSGWNTRLMVGAGVGASVVSLLALATFGRRKGYFKRKGPKEVTELTTPMISPEEITTQES